jgi:hypothetical protein
MNKSLEPVACTVVLSEVFVWVKPLSGLTERVYLLHNKPDSLHPDSASWLSIARRTLYEAVENWKFIICKP